jgi:hypothetical protein
VGVRGAQRERLASEPSVHRLAAVQEVPLQGEGVHRCTALTRQRGQREGRRERVRGEGVTVSGVGQAPLDERQHGEGRPLPVRVARVHELVGSAAEPALPGGLAQSERRGEEEGEGVPACGGAISAGPRC